MGPKNLIRTFHCGTLPLILLGASGGRGVVNGSFKVKFLSSDILPPETKLGPGNIFKSVCQEFCPGGLHGRRVCVAGGMRGGGRA